MTSNPIQPETAGKAASVRASGVSKSFSPGALVLDRISLDIAPGEFVALLGPSGSGKSTLLRLIAGLDRPSDGSIALDAGGNAPSRGFVFQDATLMPWRTVLRNTTLPLELLGWHGARAEARANEELRRVRLADYGGHRPHQLSGGMKMRASLARALVTRPGLLLLDEPFAALDEPSRHALQLQLREIWSQLGMTVLFVTHSVGEAVFLADRIVMLSHSPARILVDRPVHLPSARTASLRTSIEYIDEVRSIAVEMPARREAS